MDVRIFKLVSGVELIGEHKGVFSDYIKIRRPLQIHMMRAPDGSPSMGFAPWCMVADEEVIELYHASLACKPLTALAEVAASYVENVTGLALPQSASTAGRILME